MQWSIFSAGGAKSPPDFALESKKLTHEIILEDDLGYKIQHKANRANSELAEIHRAKIESKVMPLAKEDPNLETPADKAVEEETRYFGSILTETESFRREVEPVAVEQSLQFDIGGVPVSCRLDLISDEVFSQRVEDLKRQGAAPPIGSAATSRQLVTYAIGTKIPHVGLVAVVENKKPKIVRDTGEVSPGEIGRVTRQYQVAAAQISRAMETGDFMPVDHGDKQKAWICSAKYCGAWRIGARAWNTGELIECPFGERSRVATSAAQTRGEGEFGTGVYPIEVEKLKGGIYK